MSTVRAKILSQGSSTLREFISKAGTSTGDCTVVISGEKIEGLIKPTNPLIEGITQQIQVLEGVLTQESNLQGVIAPNKEIQGAITEHITIQGEICDCTV